MSEVGWIATIAVLVIVAAVALAWHFHSRQPPVPPQEPPPADDVRSPTPAPPPLLAYPTDRPGEVLAFGTPADLDALGPVIRALPDQLSRHAETLLAGADAVRMTAGVGGRLVRVDRATAAAVGTRAPTGQAHLLTLGRGESGSFTNVARLRSLGDGVANAAALTGAFSAMAMQAQLGRIEDGIERIAERLDHIAREQQILADSQREATATLLDHVHAAALAAGELTPSAWNQVAHLAQPILAAVGADRRRLTEALGALQSLADVSVGARTRGVEHAAETVLFRYRDYVDSCHSWVRFASLRLWHLTLVNDPSLPTYTEQLDDFIADSDLSAEGERISAHLDRMGEFAPYLHPIARRRLPRKLEEQHRRFADVDWAPLAVESSSDTNEPAPTHA